MNLIEDVFGLDVQHLTTLQMLSRASFVFLSSLIFVRIAGIRMLGKKNVFDEVSILVMGAILGRSIVSAQQPFFPSMLIVFYLMILHRIFSMITQRFPAFTRFTEGVPVQIMKDGKFLKHNMKSVQLSEEDIRASMRDILKSEDASMVEESYLEVSGKITFIIRTNGM